MTVYVVNGDLVIFIWLVWFFIIFQSGTPPENVIDDEKIYPFIVAFGSNTKDIDRYSIVVEHNVIQVSYFTLVCWIFVVSKKSYFFRFHLEAPSLKPLIYFSKHITC